MKRRTLALALMLCSAPVVYGQEAVSANPSDVADRPVSISSVATRPLNQLYVNQWVQLRASGELVGNVVSLSGESYSPVSATRVALVQNGRIVADAMSDAKGEVVFANVLPGRYTLVARGETTIGSFSVAVLDWESGRHLPAEFSVPVAEIEDRSIDALMASQFAPNAINAAPASPVADPLGRTREYRIRDYKVSLEADGSLHGNLSRPGLAPVDSGVGGTNVILFANGREVARTQSNAEGHYQFADVKPGCYSIVANGVAGFAAVSVYATAAEPAEKLSSTLGQNGVRFVSAVMQEGSGSGVNTELSSSGDTEIVEDFALEPVGGEIIDGPLAGPAPMGFPGGGGGMVGGGGAGGGGGILGGRFGGIALLGGLAGVAAAIATDDDDDDTPAIISPTVTQ